MRTIIFYILVVVLTFSLAKAQQPQKGSSLADSKVLRMPDSMARSTDGIARYILANFKTPTEKVRAAYVWLASKIEYDVAGLYAVNADETNEQRIAKMLRTRKAVCSGYALGFTDICSKVGLKSYMVDGIVKQNGVVVNLTHAWSAVLVDGAWYLFDPTWAAGYVNGGKFTRKFNNDYFMVKPEESVKSHYPFDYLFQFMSNPQTTDMFMYGKMAQSGVKTICINDSLRVYDSQNRIVQLHGIIKRMETTGVKHSGQDECLRHFKKLLGITCYNNAVADYNNGVLALNEFVNYRNRQFMPIKTDNLIQEMFDFAANHIRSADSTLTALVSGGVDVGLDVSLFKNTVKGTVDQLQEQEKWLKKYFSKGLLGRKAMFYKVTFMGVPVN